MPLYLCLTKTFQMNADGKFNKDVGYKFIEKVKDLDAELYGKIKKLADTCYAEGIHSQHIFLYS